MRHKYSFDSSIYKILKDEKSREVLFKYIPEIVDQPKFKIYKFFKVRDFLKKINTMISDDMLCRIEEDLKDLK